MAEEKLGIHIGCIIDYRIAHVGVGAVSIRRNLRSSPPVRGAFDAIARLARERFNGRVYVVSKARVHMQEIFDIWLHDHQFYPRTGVRQEDIYLHPETVKKAGIYSHLAITHLVAPRLDELRSLADVPQQFLLGGRPVDKGRLRRALPNAQQVASWEELTDLLLPLKG